MTTVALRGLEMATDSLSTIGSSRADHAPKLFRAGGALIAVCGSRALGLRFREWVLAGAHGESPYHKDADGSGLVVTRAGSYHFCKNGPLPIYAPVYAIGSGAQYALGAMGAGLDPRAAVEVAMAFDVHSGGAIQHMRLEE